MIVKLIAPGIIPNDHVTVELQGIPDRGHTICLYTGEDDEQLLTVKSVVWPMQLVPGMRHHATQADMPEVLLDRAEDVGDREPPVAVSQCKFCRLGISTLDGGNTWRHNESGRQCCYDVFKPEIATPTERN